MTEVKGIADFPRINAQRHPDKAALIFEDRYTSYSELDRLSSQVANKLLAEGLAEGTRIGGLAKNNDIYFILSFGAAKANMVFLPINYRLAPAEVAFILDDAEVPILFTDEEHLPLANKSAAQSESVKAVHLTDGNAGDTLNFWQWIEGASTDDPGFGRDPDTVALQLYTSGTTGHPKGAMLTNHNLTALMGAAREPEFGSWGEEDVSLVCMPLYHIGGLGWGMLALYIGATDFIQREVDPNAIMRDASTYGVTKAFLVPAVVLMLVQHPEASTEKFDSWGMIAYGASPMPVEVLRQAMKLMGCSFMHIYGLTETTGGVTTLHSHEYRGDDDPRLASCGRPLPGTELRIVDGAGNALPTGEVGEIIIKSPQVMKGYWNRPEANAKTIIDEWFYSGDAGYLDEDGYLYIHDRVKDMIISGGENIYPAEVEGALFEHPNIADAAVIGVPDEKWGESVKAIVVSKDGGEIPFEDLNAFMRERLAGYKCPKSVDFIKELPRNPSGKVLKRELRKPFWEDQERQVS